MEVIEMFSLIGVFKIMTNWIVNSKIYYHIYYKHTTKCKRDLEDTYNRSMAARKRIIGK